MNAINNYRVKRFNNKYFLTTDHGSYCILDKDEYTQLRSNNITENLSRKLEEKEIILNSSNILEAMNLTHKRNSFLFSATSLHIIVVTLRCNMQCLYCHASSCAIDRKDMDMDKDTAKKTVDFIFQSPNNKITIEFQGGEPLLNWDILKYIAEYALEKNKTAKKDLILTVVTNLSLMDDEKMNYLMDHDIDICTSLDGPKELHDYNRPITGASNHIQVISNISKINNEYKKRGKKRYTNALVTLTKKSLDFPEAIVDEYVRLGIEKIHLRFLNDLGRAKKISSIDYSADEFIEFWDKAISHLEKLRIKGVKISERIIDIMLAKMCGDTDPNYLDMRSPCGAAIGQLAYNFNGEIYTCDEARTIKEDLFLLGNVKNDLYKDIVTCDKACAAVEASINDQYICDSCVYKPYCGICPVLNYAEYGNIVANISQTKRCKIFKHQFDWIVKNRLMA